MIDLKIFEIFHKKVRKNNCFQYPFACFIKSFIKINGTNNCFESISKNLANLKGVIKFIIESDLFDSHLKSNLIQLITVNHFAPHLCKKPFFVIRIFFKKEIGDDSTQYGISKIFESFIIFICCFTNGTMSERGFV